jgi:acyl-coenzyme A synthetase/AMP-(fatty) acid ligase
MAHLLIQAQRTRPRQVDSLVFCVCSGDVCHPSIKEDFAALFGRTLHTSWGMTEAIGTLRVGQTPGAYAAAPECAQLVDDNGHPVDDGEAGELVIRDSTLFKGYWLGTGQIDDARKNGGFHTGDIMRKDSNGDLHYVARKKDLIVIDTSKVAPAEIERALLLHPAVAEAAVVGVPDLSLGQRIVGFVVLDASCRVGPDDILRELATRLTDYKVPERLFVVEQIPRNVLGKAIRPLLIEHALDPTRNG